MHTLRLLFLDLSIHTLHVPNLKIQKITSTNFPNLRSQQHSYTIYFVRLKVLMAISMKTAIFFLRCNAVLWQTYAKINGITYKDSNFQHSGSSSYSG